MMKHTYYEEKVNLKVWYLIVLSLLSLYGFYKNGLSYYLNNQISFWTSLRPLIICFSGLVIGGIIDLILEHKLSKNYLLGFLISVALPYQVSIIGSCVVIGLILFLFAKFKLTISPIYVALLLLVCFKNYQFTNIIESNNEIFYRTIDIFLGKSVGGVGITNILLLLIGLILFGTSFYYKKEMTVLSLGVYFIFSLLISISKTDANLFINLLNSSVIYLTIFIIPFNEFSPILKKMQIIYALISGFFIFLGTYYFNNLTGPFLGACVAYFLFYLIEVLSKKRTLIAKL